MADDYDIGAAFEAIEEELIASMMRNLSRHRAEEDKEGLNWTMWQVEQLKYLEQYKKANQKKYADQFRDINKKIEEMLRKAKVQGNTEQEQEILNAIKNGFKGFKRSVGSALTGEFFKLNERKLEALIKATTDDMQKAETAILRMANDQYRKAIYNAQVYANTGAGTYEKAVDMATKSMLAAGLNCIEYANGARHTLEDYADMAIRTASKRAYLQGEGEKRQEWGVTTVILNKRLNPCPKCLPWVGKVLIDDVWSGGSSDGKSNVTGLKYPLMSTAIEAGLYHPRCKDSHTTYFEGISTPPTGSKYTRDELDELAEQYSREQKQQYAERQEKKYSRMARYSLDEDNKRIYAARAKEWGAQVDAGAGLWPIKGVKISHAEYKELMDYGRERGIELSGFKQYDGDVGKMKELIQDAAEITKDFPALTEGKKRLTIELTELIDSGVLAVTRGHIISLNANAFRDISVLAKEYAKLEQSGWFVKGTDYRSIIRHEMGHVVAHMYGIDGLEIAMKVTGIKDKNKLMEYVENNLSQYASVHENGVEIISECFSSVYSGRKNKFALLFVEECVKVISGGR